MLSMNKRNCRRFKKEFSKEWEVKQQENTDNISKLYSDVGDLLKEKNASLTDYCEYLNWADMNGVALKGDQD